MTDTRPASSRAAYYERNAIADREYLAHAREETGRGLSPKKYAKRCAERETLRAQTEQLCGKLERAGKQGKRDALFSLGRYWVHSKKMELIPQYRRLCILPTMAAMIRADKLAALEYFLQRHRYCRFWTFTGGPLCRGSEVKERKKEMQRRLSRLSSFLRLRYGVEFVFYAVEFGTLEFDASGNVVDDKEAGRVKRDASGEPLYHVHAHCVVYSLVGYIPEGRWSEMINAVHARWEHHWDAGKIIGNARECCKYVTKPCDTLDMSDAQFGELHEIVYRQKFCVPMGTLKKEISDRKNNPAGRKILRRYTLKNGQTEWREEFDQNERAPISDEEREIADNIADAEVFAHETALALRADVEAPPDQRIVAQDTTVFDDGSTVRTDVFAGGFYAGTEVKQPDRTPDFCSVMSRLSPSIGPSGRKEPCVMVGFTRFDQEKTEKHPLVFSLWAETVQSWESGGASTREARRAAPQRAARTAGGFPALGGGGRGVGAGDAQSAPISVHTITPTVHGESGCSPGYSRGTHPPNAEDARLRAFLAQFEGPECREVILAQN